LSLHAGWWFGRIELNERSNQIDMMDQDNDARRISMALELEHLARVKATEEINEESRRAEEQAVRECATRNVLQSGIFGGRIADIHRHRAKQIVDKQIELRRATLQAAPEVATEEKFRELAESAFATIDGVLRSIPEHLKRRGFQIAVDTVGQKDESEAFALKAHARREVDMLKREHALQVIQKEKEARLAKSEAKDSRALTSESRQPTPGSGGPQDPSAPPPSAFTIEDRKFAQLAIEEARKSVPEGDGRSHPKVGAVVVKGNQVIAQAHRGEIPGCHAEYIALERKLPDDSLVDATVYTTLEPCTARNHPKVPCARRITERKVKRVVIGTLDPNPSITGRGQLMLRDANIITDLFPHDLMSEVEELNRDFARQHRTAADAGVGSAPATVELPPLGLHDCFLQDFPGVQRSGAKWPLLAPPCSFGTTVEWFIMIDLAGRSKALQFYVPRSAFTYDICVLISDKYQDALKSGEFGYFTRRAVGETGPERSIDWPFNNSIYIYHEDSLTVQQLSKLTSLFSSKSITVWFRGLDYVTHLNLGRRTP
jgi:pyrimidine deaminase RibD-like protein